MQTRYQALKAVSVKVLKSENRKRNKKTLTEKKTKFIFKMV